SRIRTGKETVNSRRDWRSTRRIEGESCKRSAAASNCWSARSRMERSLSAVEWSTGIIARFLLLIIVDRLSDGGGQAERMGTQGYRSKQLLPRPANPTGTTSRGQIS